MDMYALDRFFIPRQAVRRHPLPDLGRLIFVMLECGGPSRFVSQRMVPHRAHIFNSEGGPRYLALLAEMLRSRPQGRGLVSSAWYNDPVVARISPHLACLRESLDRLGAQIFWIGITAEVVEDAFARSATRRRPHAAGTYILTAYLVVLSRSALLRAFDPDPHAC